MKKLLPILNWVGMGLAILLVVFVFVTQFQAKQKLNKELTVKKAELLEAESASRRMAELEKKSQGLRQKEIKMKRRVVVGDTQPLELIKAITGLASKTGLRKIKFELKTSSQIAVKDPPALLRPRGPGRFLLIFRWILTLHFPKRLNSLKI